MSKSEILTKFETLATIPHCSYDTDKMRDFLADFARDKGCEVVVDRQAKNLLAEPLRYGLHGRRSKDRDRLWR